MSFFENVYNICRKIPKGKVATYGQIAMLARKSESCKASSVGLCLLVNIQMFHVIEF